MKMQEPIRSSAETTETDPSTARTVPENQARSGTSQVRTRRKPQISDTPPAPPPAPTLADYEPIIGKSQVDELRFVARALKGKRMKMVNSTAMGGGVAEMLVRL